MIAEQSRAPEYASRAVLKLKISRAYRVTSSVRQTKMNALVWGRKCGDGNYLQFAPETTPVTFVFVLKEIIKCRYRKAFPLQSKAR